jgi:excisionase family DNA binding protein
METLSKEDATPMPMTDILTVRQAAARAQVSERTIYGAYQRGELRACQPGGRNCAVRILEADLYAWLRGQTPQQQQRRGA